MEASSFSAAAANYDARGNTTSIGSSGFAYDFNNQPVTVTGTGAATFLYDGNLKRVKEVRAGKTIYTVYSRVTGGLIYKDEMTDGKTTAYVSAGQASVRFGYNNGTLATAEYIHADHLGSPIAATNAAGNVTWRESYRPFGKALRIFGSAPANDNSTGFTGHLEDDASGLVYMQARYYDPLVGRFLATDPVGYQDQLNLYAYVYNDPINATDPTGECGPLSHICAGAAIGAVGGFVSYAIETAGTGEFTAGGAIANAAKGAAVGVAVASGAGIATVAVVGGTANAVEDATTAISSKEGVSEGIAAYTDGPGGAAGALATSFVAGAGEAVVGGAVAKGIGNLATGALKTTATSSATAATDTVRGAVMGLAEPAGDLAGEAAVAAYDRVQDEIRDDQLRHSD